MKLNELWKRFKSVIYGDVHIAAVVYIDLSGTGILPELGKRALIFSGVTSRGRASTINSAREIIEAIVKQESIDINSRDFYDLQTYKGYEHLKLGNFILDRVSLQHGSPSWDNVTIIPNDFQNIFYNLIGHFNPVRI